MSWELRPRLPHYLDHVAVLDGVVAAHPLAVEAG
jgi:hypothetical protein